MHKKSLDGMFVWQMLWFMKTGLGSAAIYHHQSDYYYEYQ